MNIKPGIYVRYEFTHWKYLIRFVQDLYMNPYKFLKNDDYIIEVGLLSEVAKEIIKGNCEAILVSVYGKHGKAKISKDGIKIYRRKCV